MSEYRLWPFAVLAVGVVYFLWDGDDQTTTDQLTQQEERSPTTTSPTRPTEMNINRDWQTSSGYPTAIDSYSSQPMGYSPYVQPFSSSDNYRFRPYRDVNRDRNEYESAYPPIQERGHPMTAGEPAYPGLPGYGAYQYPKNTYRFRPLDKQRNERRWHGNYGQTLIDQAPSPNPYHRQSYPIYTPQSGPEPDPLWANSWPDQ